MVETAARPSYRRKASAGMFRIYPAHHGDNPDQRTRRQRQLSESGSGPPDIRRAAHSQSGAPRSLPCRSTALTERASITLGHNTTAQRATRTTRHNSSAQLIGTPAESAPHRAGRPMPRGDYHICTTGPWHSAMAPSAYDRITRKRSTCERTICERSIHERTPLSERCSCVWSATAGSRGRCRDRPRPEASRRRRRPGAHRRRTTRRR